MCRNARMGIGVKRFSMTELDKWSVIKQTQNHCEYKVLDQTALCCDIPNEMQDSDTHVQKKSFTHEELFVADFGLNMTIYRLFGMDY